MLLLSLLVTSLGQATQAALRLRGRNLQTGLSVILDPELQGGKDKRQLAAAVLNDEAIASINKVPDPHSAAAKIRGPAVSWVEPETLEAVLSRMSDDNEIDVERTVDRFSRYRQAPEQTFFVHDATGRGVLGTCYRFPFSGQYTEPDSAALDRS